MAERHQSGRISSASIAPQVRLKRRRLVGGMNLGYRVVSSYLTDTDLSRRETRSVRGVVADSIRIPNAVPGNIAVLSWSISSPFPIRAVR
jgi:hypothetical protein